MTVRPWQDAVTELVATGLNERQVTLLLEVVTSVTRHVTRDGSSRSNDAERAARYRKKARLLKQLAGANDAAGARDEERDASRDAVTGHCESESVVRQRDSQEEGSTKGVVDGQKARRGTRMVHGAVLADDDLQFALDAGMTPDAARKAWAEFVDYWIGVPGQRGTKLDWPATWRNRVRQIAARAPRKGAPSTVDFRDIADQLRGPDETPVARFEAADAEHAGPGQFDFGSGVSARR